MNSRGAWRIFGAGSGPFRRAGPAGPLGRLVRAFNAAAADVQARIDGLERDRQQLLVVLEAMAEAVIAVDSRHRLLFANAGANRLFWLDGTSVGRLVPELIRSPRVQEAVEATLRLSAPQSYKAEVVLAGREAAFRGQGPERHLAVRGTPLPGVPSPGAVLVFHDVTDLRRLERMRQDFVANASHELKTPLASIKAYTETLLDWALHDDSVNVRFLERIDEQAERLNQLVLDLLSLARLESGRDVFDHQPLEVVPVLEACVEAHRGRASAKNLDLTFDSTGLDEATLILADEEAVRQIADNLIDNAIKYTPEHGSVHVRCSLQADTGRRRGDRHRHRHPPRRPAAHLRAVLPRRQGPQPRARGDRAGALDRQASRPVHRRADRCDQPRRLRLDVHRLLPPPSGRRAGPPDRGKPRPGRFLRSLNSFGDRSHRPIITGLSHNLHLGGLHCDFAGGPGVRPPRPDRRGRGRWGCMGSGLSAVRRGSRLGAAWRPNESREECG